MNISSRKSKIFADSAIFSYYMWSISPCVACSLHSMGSRLFSLNNSLTESMVLNVNASDLAISAVTLFELAYGAAKANWGNNGEKI